MDKKTNTLVKALVRGVRNAPNEEHATGLVIGMLFMDRVQETAVSQPIEEKTSIKKKTTPKRNKKYRVKRGKKRYTKAERAILNNPKISLTQKKRLIKGRTIAAIKTQHFLALKDVKNVDNTKRKRGKAKSSYVRWTNDDDKFLKKSGSRNAKINYFKRQGRSRSAVLNRMHRLNLY